MSKRTEEIETKRGPADAFIRDPAHAIAAGKCWIARSWGGPLAMSAIADHQDQCAWCEFEPDYIIEKITEFIAWAGLERQDRRDTGDPLVRPLRGAVEGFMMLPEHEQKRLVRDAQGFTTDPLVEA